MILFESHRFSKIKIFKEITHFTWKKLPSIYFSLFTINSISFPVTDFSVPFTRTLSIPNTSPFTKFKFVGTVYSGVAWVIDQLRTKSVVVP